MSPVRQYFEDGGATMWPLLVCSVIALAIIFERLVFWARFWLRADAKLRRELTGLYIPADRVRKSRDEVALILADLARNPDEPTIAVLRAERVVRETKRHLGMLSLMTSVSTSLGLFGTVWGVSLAFKSLSLGEATQLSSALSIALNTTVFGLLIYLPAFMMWSFFNHLSTNVGLDIEEAFERIRSGARARREKLGSGSMKAAMAGVGAAS